MSSSSSDTTNTTNDREKHRKARAESRQQALPLNGTRKCKGKGDRGDDQAAHGKKKRRKSDDDDEELGKANPEALLALTAFEDRWEKDVAEWKTTKPGQRRSNMPQYLKQFNKEMKQDVWIAGKAFITHKADHKCWKACEQIMRKINPPEFHGLKGATLKVYEERWIKAHLPFTASSMNNCRNYFYSQVQKVYKAAFLDGKLDELPNVLEMRMLLRRTWPQNDNKWMEKLVVIYHDVLLPAVAGCPRWGPTNRCKRIISVSTTCHPRGECISPMMKPF